MNLTKITNIKDEFRCPLYAENELIITYKLCIDRQIAMSVQKTPLYEECYRCPHGKHIKEHFKRYKPKPRKAEQTFTQTSIANRKRQISLNGDCKNCQKLQDLKVLIKAQVEFALDLAIEGKLDKALERIRLIREAI